MTTRTRALVGAVVGVLGLVAGVVSCVALGAMVDEPEEWPRQRTLVSVEQPGARVEDVDRQLAAPLARALADLDADVEIVSRPGRVDALLTARTEDDVVAQARARLESFDLPAEASSPSIRALPPARVRWIVSGPRGEDRLRSIARRVETVPGVAELASCALAEELHVVIDPSRAAALDVDPLAVVEALRRGNEQVPAGRIEAGDHQVHIRIAGADGPDDFADIVVAVRDGRVARIRDVASVERTRAPSGCECIDAEGPCASGAVFVDPRATPAVHTALREASVSGPPGDALEIVDAWIPIAAPSMDRDRLRELATRVAQVVQEAPGVRRAALELHRAHDPVAPPTPLVLLLALEEGASLPAISAHLLGRVPGVVLVPERLAAHVIAEDVALARDTAEDVALALRGATGIGAVWVASGRGAPELRVDLDRERLARAGVDARRVTAMVRLATEGEVATEWSDHEQRYAVRVRVASSLEDLRIRVPAGGPVALRELATIAMIEGVTELHRCGEAPCVPVFVDADDAAIERARERVASIELPPGVSVAWR